MHKNRDTLKALHRTAVVLWPPKACQRGQPLSGRLWRWPLKRLEGAPVSSPGCETALVAEKANAVELKDEAAPGLAAEVVSDVVGATEPAFWVSELVEVHGLVAWKSS